MAQERSPERVALVERLQVAMPAAMRELPQWLLWRFEHDSTRPKPLKVPYYADGRKRMGTQGDEGDRRRLVSFDAALARLGAHGRFDGLGFAFLPGDGLVGVDIDGAIDGDTGEISPMCTTLIEACASYTERSPSGRGVHIIMKGSTKTFTDDSIGLEVYCSKQYFTCSGDRLAGTPGQVQPLADDVLAYMHSLVDEAKGRAQAVKLQQNAAEVAAAASSSAPAAAPSTGGDDFKRVNDAALRSLEAWVPEIFAKARRSGTGYRVTSRDLGRELQEDLSITPEGIMDFGEEQGYTAIDLVLRWAPAVGSKPKDALHWLAPKVGVALRPLRLVAAGSPTDAGDPRPIPPPLPPDSDGMLGSAAGENVVPLAGRGNAAAKGDGGGRKKPPRDEKPVDWTRYTHLLEHFALIYSTDTVWDASTRLIMKISAMAHAHGADYVRMWKAASSNPCRVPGTRWTVMPADVVFDPQGKSDPDRTVNLFGGLALEPKAGDVEPMLQLVRHLTSRASDKADECDQVMHWLLCWMAYPLQHLGAKLRTAVIMHGDEGAGKNFLFDTQVMLYGEYGATVGQDELEDKFNDWRSRKLFVVGDEVSSRQELVHNKNRLKALITSPTVQINPKNLPRREEANHMNVAFLSNEIQPQALDNTDRRYCVIFTPQALEIDFYKRLGQWRREGGLAAWMAYLMAYPLEDFDPYSPAPLTAAKADLIDLNRKTPERFWAEWSGEELGLVYMTCAVDQAYRAFTKYCQRVGDRFPLQKPVFSRMLVRMSESMKRPARIKSMKVVAPDGATRTCRMFLVTDPLPAEGQGEGDWATECVVAFEKLLRTYLHGPHFPDTADQGGDGRP